MTPKVSVAMITYNHERFIAQAIESVLMQQTDFDYELVIGEDCSTDGTADTVRRYQAAHPDKIRAILREQNIGMIRNSVDVLKACRGTYVAALEGDDYWTDPLKLQKQVDYLESHPECAMCFTNALAVHEDGSRPPYEMVPPEQKEISALEDILERNFIPTCTVMFRNGPFGDFPDWYHTLPIGDWPLHILNAQHGKIGYINELTGIYRIHRGGMWTSRHPSRATIEALQVLACAQQHLGDGHARAVEKGVARMLDYWVGWLLEYDHQGYGPVTMDNIDAVFVHWPVGLPLSVKKKRQVIGRICAGLAFSRYWARDVSAVRWWAARAIATDSVWLRDRGLRSIFVESLLGPRIAGRLRRLVHRLRPQEAA